MDREYNHKEVGQLVLTALVIGGVFGGIVGYVIAQFVRVALEWLN